MIHVHRGLLPLSETCAMRDVKVLPSEAIPDPSELTGRLANISALPTSQALMAAQSAVTVAAGCWFSEIQASKIQMLSLGAIDNLLARDEAGEAVLSSAIEVGKRIGGGCVSLDTLKQVGDTLVAVASKITKATGGNPVKTQQLAASTLSTHSSITSRFAAGSSRQSLAEGSKIGASIVDSSRAVKSQLGDALARGLVPGAGSTILEANGISMVLTKEYADKASGETFGHVSSDAPQRGRRSLLDQVAMPPQASMPETMGDFCSTNLASCTQPLTICLTFTSDSSCLIAGLGQDSFTRALAGHLQGGQSGGQLRPNTAGAVLISGVFTIEVIGLSQNVNIGSNFSIWIPIDGQVAASRAVSGYFCVSIDYVRMSPFVAAEAELLDGIHASCNVTHAGDYVIAQLADLRAQVEKLPGYNGPRAGAGSFRPFTDGESDDDGGGGGGGLPTWSKILFIATAVLTALTICSGWLYVKFRDPSLDLEYQLANCNDKDEFWPENLGAAAHRRGFGSFRANASGSLITCEWEDGIELKYIQLEPKMEGGSSNTNSLRNPEEGLAHPDDDKQVSSSTKRVGVPLPSSFPDDNGAIPSGQESSPITHRDMRRTVTLLADQHLKFSKANQGLAAHPATFYVKGSRNILTSSLHEAAAEGKAEVINKLLLQMEARFDATFDINMRNIRGSTPVHLAARAGHVDALHALLRPVGWQVVDLNAQDGAGRTPLHLCVVGGHTEALKVLLPETATDLPRGTTGHCPVPPPAEIKFAFGPSGPRRGTSRRVDIGISDSKHGWTALHWAAGRGQEEMVHLLAQYIEAAQGGQNKSQSAINVQDYAGRSALHLASAYGHTGVVKRLLEAPSCSPLLTDWDGWTALHAAASYGHVGVVGEIMAWSTQNKQSAASTVDRSGATPLLLASKRGHVDTVRMILDTEAKAAVLSEFVPRSDGFVAGSSGVQAVPD